MNVEVSENTAGSPPPPTHMWMGVKCNTDAMQHWAGMGEPSFEIIFSFHHVFHCMWSKRKTLSIPVCFTYMPKHVKITFSVRKPLIPKSMFEFSWS